MIPYLKQNFDQTPIFESTYFIDEWDLKIENDEYSEGQIILFENIADSKLETGVQKTEYVFS